MGREGEFGKGGIESREGIGIEKIEKEKIIFLVNLIICMENFIVFIKMFWELMSGFSIVVRYIINIFKN